MTSVKYFHSAMVGAPVLSGTAGSLIAVLDACLVTGFGLNTCTISVSGGVATATFSAGHSFEPDTTALIAGATPAGLNGEKCVLTTSTNTITFVATGVADGAATGTSTAKLAPAGFAKEFAGTNLAAYRAISPESTRMFLRVDDTGTTIARVVGYESMSDVSTGAGPFPTSTQISGGGWWPKASPANATARVWTLVADSRGFYLHTHTATSSPGASGSVWWFGDFASFKSGDAYACSLHCSMTENSGGTNPNTSNLALEICVNASLLGAYFPRSFTALGGAVAGQHYSSEYATGTPSGNTAQPQAPAYPNGPDNGLILARKWLVEPSVCRRGAMPGFYVVPQNCHAAFNWRDKIDGQGELAGHKLLAIKCGSPASTSSQGVVFIDITGPWSR